MIIDFHTHIFPDKIAEKAVGVLEQNVYNNLGIEKKAHTKATLSSLSDSMKEHNIDISVVMPIATSTKQSASINSFAVEVNKCENFFSFGSVHPMQEDALEILENIKGAGLLGIKLHPDYQGFFIDSEESLRVLKKCEELGLYVMLHAGEDIGIKPPVHCTPIRIINALEHLDGKNIIAAHMGGYNMWSAVIDHLCQTPIYFDTSYSVGEMPDDVATQIIKTHGFDKILFATDSPWQNQGYVVKRVKGLNLGKEAEDAIFYKNGAKILGLKI